MGSEERKPPLEAPSLGFRRRKKAPAARPSGEQSPVSEPATVDDTPPDPAPRPPRRPVNGHLAAALAGLVVGAFLVLGTLGGLRACQSTRGTTSCGGGPGFLLLMLIAVVAVVLGAVVLRWTQVPSAGSISFLAVALVAVLSVLFLLGSLDQVAGAVAVAVLTVASYLLARWVTVRYIDTEPER